MAKKSENKDAKVVTTKSIISDKKASKDGLVEVELLKDHGVGKKGDKLMKHPKMAEMLIDRKIAK